MHRAPNESYIAVNYERACDRPFQIPPPQKASVYAIPDVPFTAKFQFSGYYATLGKRAHLLPNAA